MNTPRRRAAIVAAMGLLLGLLSSAPAMRAASADGIHESVPLRAAVWRPWPELAAGDSTLNGFLRNMSDSTDRYFGISAAPSDTAGNDSALAFGLVNPRYERRKNFGIVAWPDLDFNRVDGPVYGVQVRIGQPLLLGQLVGKLGYVVGPNEWHGYGGIRKSFAMRRATWNFDVSGGGQTSLMNRERHGMNLPGLRAFTSGKDNRHYLRRDGVDAGLEREARSHWRVGMRFRDMLEKTQVTTTTWNLSNAIPSVVQNMPATDGRTNEFLFYGGWLLPMLPVTLEANYWTSAKSIGSDFEYRRLRLAAAGDFGLGRHATLVPQAMYGRKTGEFVNQEAFYMGGSHTLRSIRSESMGGTGIALARLDLIGHDDIMRALHIPHPDAVPIQAGLFTALGSVWGQSPFGAPTVPGESWPEKNSWRSEVGAALYYRPGFPTPTTSVIFHYARGLGPESQSHFGLSIVKPMDLVRPFSE